MKLLVFRSGCTFLNPTSNACCFTFSPAFAVVGFKNCSHSSGCKVVSYCDFNLCFLIGHNVEYLSCFFFSFLLASLLWKVYSSFLVILKMELTFHCWFLWVIYVFCIQILCQIYELWMFLPVCGLFFHFFLTVTLDEWEFLTLMKPNLSVVFLSEGVLFVSSLRDFYLPEVKYFSIFPSGSFIVLTL